MSITNLPLVDCKHWHEHRCSLGLHNGKPQLDDCSKCRDRLAWDGTRVHRPRPNLGTIPEDYNPKNWRLDSRGNAGCGCAE